LSLPITIRIYPQEADYYNLNALALGAMHSHVGAREIALIASIIN